jgi:hypothetical protein
MTADGTTQRGRVNYYQGLGAREDATQEELHQAYLAKQSQLVPERFVGAPDEVLGAVKRASVVVDQARNVLGDVALRGNYDADLSLSATNAGEAPSDSHEGVPSEEWLASPLYDPLSAAERIAEWLAPSGRADPHVTVPDVCGLRGSQPWWPAADADLRLSVVRLTEHPAGDGIVVDQDPPAGTRVRRRSTLTIQVVWDSADSGESSASGS